VALHKQSMPDNDNDQMNEVRNSKRIAEKDGTNQ
jgi:hypothetical protein